MTPRHITDPVEKVVADALMAAEVPFYHGTEHNTLNLDFFLPDSGVYIECKRFHTPRVTEQMSRAENIIVIQGMEAAKLFASLISGKITDVI